jgi:type I restriction enzyme S subunit
VNPVARVADLAEQIRGVSYDKEDASSTPRPGFLPVLRAGNITDDGLVFDDLVFVPAGRIADKQKIRRNDVIIAASSGSPDVVGKAARALDDYDGGFGAFCKVLRPRPDVDPSYFAHFFRTPEYRRRVSALAAGININNLRNEHLDELLIPLPPLPEQRRIAEILNKADALRAKRRAALAQLNTLTQSIFLDMFGDPATNPKGWPLMPMSTLFAEAPIFGTMIPPSANGGRWLSLRVANIQDWKLDLTDQKFVDLPNAMVARHSVRDGDVLIARAIASREHLGKAVVVHPVGREWAFDSHLMRLRFDRQRAEPEFVHELLRTNGGRQIFLRATRRSAVQFNINTKEISALQIPVPPIRLQCAFVRRIANAQALRSTGSKTLERLGALFTALQHRAFTGEL